MTAWLLYGGITFPFAMGVVVEGVDCAFHTPLTGHCCPVRAVMAMLGSLARFVRFESETLIRKYNMIRKCASASNLQHLVAWEHSKVEHEADYRYGRSVRGARRSSA